MIAANERLIMALDVPDTQTARQLAETLADSVQFFKVGLELFMSPGFFELVEWLQKRDKRIFVDLKLFDVPATVGRAIARLSDKNIDFVSIHGNQSMMESAAAYRHGNLKILAVTALTSLDQGDLNDFGFECDVKSLVLSRAKRALAAGCDGVVSSGLEVSSLRAYAPNKLITVTPGIRPVANQDDQKRTMTPSQAIQAGSDYLVIGRPIRDAADPRQAAQAIQTEIQTALETRS